ncbi:hypothetical protein BCE_0459 [Bacillus cereus ATCC 10987]|uniref:Uncharacterized protein n=1 Tax=Bacillus cereus (strain ATCC 10987 / NRS 248) TaxID=222523 RepID=Q73EA0_BACC1|nr:hypothetical protein BCE_0459 [Bacillus cereus ATCC 10987]
MFIFTQQEHFSEKYFLLAHYAIGKKSPLSFLALRYFESQYFLATPHDQYKNSTYYLIKL